MQTQSKWLGYIEYQLDRLSHLTDEMLLMVHLDSPEQHIKENFNLSSLLYWYLESLNTLISKKNITLNKNIEENTHIYADKELITRLIIILIDNTIKYTPNNGMINITLHQVKKNFFVSRKFW